MEVARASRSVERGVLGWLRGMDMHLATTAATHPFVRPRLRMGSSRNRN